MAHLSACSQGMHLFLTGFPLCLQAQLHECESLRQAVAEATGRASAAEARASAAETRASSAEDSAMRSGKREAALQMQLERAKVCEPQLVIAILTAIVHRPKQIATTWCLEGSAPAVTCRRRLLL